MTSAVSVEQVSQESQKCATPGCANPTTHDHQHCVSCYLKYRHETGCAICRKRRQNPKHVLCYPCYTDLFDGGTMPETKEKRSQWAEGLIGVIFERVPAADEVKEKALEAFNQGQFLTAVAVAKRAELQDQLTMELVQAQTDLAELPAHLRNHLADQLSTAGQALENGLLSDSRWDLRQAQRQIRDRMEEIRRQAASKRLAGKLGVSLKVLRESLRQPNGASRESDNARAENTRLAERHFNREKPVAV